MFADELPQDEATRLAQAYAPLRTFEQRMTSPGFRRMYQERNTALARTLLTQPPRRLMDCNILDFGCGSGRVTKLLIDHGASPHRTIGVDIQNERITEALLTYPELRFLETDGETLPFDAKHFDIVLAFTAFSSIIDPMIAARAAVEISRVLAKGGIVIWYDLRYAPFRPNLRAMTKTRIRNLFPQLWPQLQPLTLLPPLAERLGTATDTLYPVLSRLPGLRSHYFGVLRS